MGNLIVTLILLVIVSLASWKLILDKKNGVKCSGCPSSPSGKNSGASCSMSQSTACSIVDLDDIE